MELTLCHRSFARCSGEITRFKSLIKRDALFTRGGERRQLYARTEDCSTRYYDIDLRDDEWKASIDHYRDITGLLFERLSINQTSRCPI